MLWPAAVAVASILIIAMMWQPTEARPAMALSAVPHAHVAASVTPRHRGRYAAACGRHAVGGGPCRAASDDASSSTRVEFEGRILQDVRAGQEGFATTLRVAGGSPGAFPGEGACEGDLVTVAYTATLTGDDDGPHTELEVGSHGHLCRTAARR
jgi:hypothetical protein